MVTGAGGSIGSELCRQISRVGPSRLVLVDHAEDNLFAIERELVEDRHFLNVAAVLADCREEERMREVFAAERPNVVFHAAAYKHVALMEANPVEAVRNNSLATEVMTRVAGEAGTTAFVLVSTDKAVEPATVMGASKALAEWAVEAADQRYPRTTFSAVRFGNVLGSSGSVVPIFRRQIDALLHDDPGGGPARHPGRIIGRRRRTVCS
jgi:FlaA1/EpsC-like NDP-sugar epimerase